MLHTVILYVFCLTIFFSLLASGLPLATLCLPFEHKVVEESSFSLGKCQEWSFQIPVVVAHVAQCHSLHLLFHKHIFFLNYMLPCFRASIGNNCCSVLALWAQGCRGVLTLFWKMPGAKFSNFSRGSACCTLSFFTCFVSQFIFLNYLLQGSHGQQLLLCAWPFSKSLSMSCHSLWENARNEVIKFQLW